MKGYRVVLSIVVLLIFVLKVNAQRKYQYVCLEHIAKSLNISSEIEMLPRGIFMFSYQGRPVKVCIDKNRIHHIGYSLFPLSFRYLSNSAIYDFVERYFLELHLKIGKEKDMYNRMQQDGVVFFEGNFNTLVSLVGKENLFVQLVEHDAKTCQITLSLKNDTCVFVFPIEYDLLHSSDMLENEKNLIEDLKVVSDSIIASELPDSTSLNPLYNGISVLLGETIYSDKLSSNQYYTVSNGRVLPVDDKELLNESLANLFGGLISENQYKMRIQLIKYNYQSETLFLSLNQWIRFCQNNNSQFYFGLIGVMNQTAECEWIMRNKVEGYCHVMRIYVPLENWEQKTGVIVARLNTYIPISKIKNLFEENND